MAIVQRTFISPDEVYPNRVVTYAELAARAAGLNRTESVHFLGFVNLLLSSATTETHLTNRLEPVRDVQTWVLRELLSADLLRDLKARFRSTSLLDRPILHRTQVLFAIRLIATHGDANGGNRLLERADFDAIGDLLFLVNGLFAAEPPGSKGALPLWVATQMGPMHETENPPDLQLSWPRTNELLSERLLAAADDPQEIERLEQITVFTSGFSLQAWLDLSWMFFSFWGTVKFQDLMKARGRGYLDTGKPHEVISKEKLILAVEALGTRFEDLPHLLRIETFSTSTLFDLTPFRTKPLWIMPDGLVLCIDASMLMERLGPHVFWSAMNALDTKERRNTFSATWGLAFENYCADVLRVIFGAKKWALSLNPKDASTNEELFDAISTRDDTAVVIECKGTYDVPPVLSSVWV